MFIFDFDGTIANTEDYHFMAWNDVLSEYGVTLTDADFLRYIGKKDEIIMPMVEEDFNIKIADYDEFTNRRVVVFIEKYLPQIKPYSYFVEIYNKQPQMCIVSNQNYDVIKTFFQYNNMQMPIVYSASRLGISKEELIADIKNKYDEVTLYEDVDCYLKFAKSIGCKTVGIEYKYNIGTLQNADKIIIGFNEK